MPTSRSTSGWASLPPELVKAHLNLDDATMAGLSKTKPIDRARPVMKR